MAETLRLSDQGHFATTLDGDPSGIIYELLAGDGSVVTIDPLAGTITPLRPGLAQVVARKDELELDSLTVVVKSDVQYAFDNAKRSGAVRVVTNATPISTSITPPVVTPPVLSQFPGNLAVDWSPPTNPSAAITQLLLDVRSLDGQVILANGQVVTNAGKPYHFVVADARTYRVTLTAVNAAFLTASAFADLHAGENAITAPSADGSGAPLVLVSFTSEQVGARAYTITFYDDMHQVAFQTTVVDSGTSHTITVDTTGMAPGIYTVEIEDATFQISSPPTPPTSVSSSNVLGPADAFDAGDGTVTVTWTNTDPTPRSYTLAVYDDAGHLVASVPYSGGGTSQSASIDFTALGLGAGGYSVHAVDDTTSSVVASVEFPYGGTTSGGEDGALSSNDALSANAMASTAGGGTTAAMAFDGSNATFWQSAGLGAGVAGESLGQDFGASPVELGRVVLVQDFAGGAYAASGKIQYADTLGNWFDATPDTPFTGNAVTFDEILPVGVHRYWQVVFTQGNPNNEPVRVTEMNMYPYAVPSEGFGQTPFGTGPYGY